MRFHEFDTYRLLTEAESSPRIPHPEDAIFISKNEAVKYARALEDAINNAENISIKWDGGIALYFGISPEGKFFINDKYMPEGFYAYSPDDWIKYDTEIKKSKTARPDLYKKLSVIWKGLQQSVTDKSVFKGDLMAVTDGEPLEPIDNKFVFKPTTVTYSIPVSSPLGKLIQGKVGVIVVHQQNNAPWDGKSGLANRGNVAIIAPKAGLSFKLTKPAELINDVRTTLSTQGDLAENFLNGLANVVRGKLQTYFNQKITKQTSLDLLPWLEKNVSGKQYQLLTSYLKDNSKGLKAVENIWNSIYRLKDNLTGQLDMQVKSFDQSINGERGGEGFVVPTSAGLVKLVNREQFGGAHFNK